MGERGGKAVRVFVFFWVLAAALLVSGGVAVAAAWGPAFPVSPAAIDDLGAREATVLADDDGNFTYVWLQQRGFDNFSIYSRAKKADGSSTDTVEVASTDSEGYPSSLNASMGPGGIAHLTFVRFKPGPPSSEKFQYLALDTDGRPAGPEQTLEATVPGSGDFFGSKAMDTGSQGNTAIAWTRRDASEAEGIMGAAIVSAGTVRFIREVPVDGSALSTTANVTSSGDAVVGVTYEKNNAPNPFTSGFLARSLNQDSSLGPERVIAPEAAESVAEPASGLDGSDKLTFIFRRDQVVASIFARQMDSEGNVLGVDPTLISGADALSSETLASVGLDVADDGTVAIGWKESAPDVFIDQAWMRLISADGSLTPPRLLSPPTDASPVPAVALSPAGGGMAVFSRFDVDEDAAVIEARSFDASGALIGPVTRLDTTGDPDDAAFVARAAFDGNGDAAALWGVEIFEQGGEDEFRSSILDATGPEIEIWSPPRATAGLEIAIAADGRDRNPVSYEWTFGDGGSASGAFARHTYSNTGTSEIELTATDSAGNVTTETAAIEIIPAFVNPPDPPVPPDPPAPPIPPDTKITVKPKKKVKSKTATFRFVSSLSGSEFECRVDKAGWSSCRSPKKLKKLKPGKHTFRVRATKGDLFDQSPASYSWTVKK